MKPATSLPWTFDAERDNSANKDQMKNEPIGGSIMGNGYYIARIWSDCDSPVENATYIVAACNAYPRLVALLKTYAESLPVPLHKAVLDGSDAVALLRELGEL